MNKIFAAGLMFGLMLFLVGCGDDDPTGPEQDHEAPSVSIVYPADMHFTNYDVDIRVEAVDNDTVMCVEMKIDGDVVAVDSTVPYEKTVVLTDLTPGTHSISAKAYDRNGNSTISDPVSVVYVYDIAPEGNGYLRISITSYACSSGAVDPYFVFALYEDDDTTVVESSCFENQYILTNPYYHDFDIDDASTSICAAIWVRDDNLISWSPIDYTPVSSGTAYIFTVDTDEMPVEYNLNGAEDHVEYEDDCQLGIEFSIVEGS